jgi:hypothetical protein
MVARTSALVSAFTCGLPLMTRETVWCETPATRATSQMLVAAGPRSGTALGASPSMLPFPVTLSFSEP